MTTSDQAESSPSVSWADIANSHVPTGTLGISNVSVEPPDTGINVSASALHSIATSYPANSVSAKGDPSSLLEGIFQSKITSLEVPAPVFLFGSVMADTGIAMEATNAAINNRFIFNPIVYLIGGGGGD